MELDLALRMRVHALQETLAAHAPAGIIDVTPGIRSLQIHTDAGVLRPATSPRLLQRARGRGAAHAPSSSCPRAPSGCR